MVFCVDALLYGVFGWEETVGLLDNLGQQVEDLAGSATAINWVVQRPQCGDE